MRPATPMLWSGHPVQLILALAVSITISPTLSTSLQLSAYRSGSRHVLPRSLELRGGGEDAGGGASGDGKRSSTQHWMRSGAPPPRYTHPLSGPKMESILKDLELDLENEEDAKIDAIIRELDRDLPPDEDEDPAHVEALQNHKDRALLLENHTGSLYNYAQALHVSGDAVNVAEAVGVYQKALASSHISNTSSSADLLCAAAVCNNLGVLYYTDETCRNFTAANDMYEQALTLNPLCAEAMCNLAVLLQGVGQRVSTRETIKVDATRAEELLRRALQILPDHPPALTHLAYVLEYHAKQYDEAERLYRRALELEPTHYILLSNLAGFLCNVREPFDPETLMPVYFNMTCNTDGSYDPDTGIAINPKVDRPVDRARELYYLALQHLPLSLTQARHVGDGEEDGSLSNVPPPLVHGQFYASIAPPIEGGLASVSAEDVDAKVSQLQAAIAQLQALR